MNVKIVDALAVKVGPEEVLIIHVPQSWPVEACEGLLGELARIGLAGRCLVINADGVELAVVKKDPE